MVLNQMGVAVMKALEMMPALAAHSTQGLGICTIPPLGVVPKVVRFDDEEPPAGCDALRPVLWALAEDSPWPKGAHGARLCRRAERASEVRTNRLRNFGWMFIGDRAGRVVAVFKDGQPLKERAFFQDSRTNGGHRPPE